MTNILNPLIVEEVPLVISITEGEVEESVVPDGINYLIVNFDDIMEEEPIKLVKHELKDFEIDIRFQESIFALVSIVKKAPRKVYEFVCKKKGDKLIPITSNYQEVPMIVLERVIQILNQDMAACVKLTGRFGSFDILYRDLVSILNQLGREESMDEFLWNHTLEDVETIHHMYFTERRTN
ncbi:hypothetical protein J2Z48_002986 [Croceifilum oryzae]|uniref:Uncharacterized protein n=1 Tax=Croceifilum oryzae TaxID=1553429 RepID=A0AAJ1WRQ9_9BACL|nr:hypothetical protein [Croceifilum oryzae]MDQ0418782.1 hypothetical protein [Croceifilum oryzae]